jgi:hypothetical protein
MNEIDNQHLIYNAIHIVILSLGFWALSKYLIKIKEASFLKSFFIIINVYVVVVLFLVDIEIRPNSVYFAILLSVTMLMSSVLSKYIFDIPWLKSIKLMSIFIGLISGGLVVWTFCLL